jgi:hypothetical protein
MERLGRELELELGRLGPGAAASGIDSIVAAWPGAVGDEIARNAWPARLGSDGTLHVATRSSTWAFELSQLSGQVGDRLRDVLGPVAPLRLRFAVGRLPEPAVAPPATPVEAVRSPGAEERAQAGYLTRGIEDEELREAVARAAAASLLRAADRRSF